MSINTPDRWKLIKIVGPRETLFKVLAGWSGGYLDSEYWKINSGITRMKEKKEHYIFYGYSGSIYKCFKGREGFTALSGNIWSQLQSSLQRVSLTSIDELKESLA
jgi:hypothetical protein